ncbi:unnamed protein product [Paramecium pentaurelia]|uniref:Protein kinase domain-containing protein n=1 Tax=Paramecium pentaurelia TaxID=43138 RepID=A0A8S1UZY3_9CILI|nr:unnamed protein product [Paramecium pentaurelia]
MIEEIESLYRNRAILEKRMAQQSPKQVLVDALCDDLDAFLEYESQITGSYIRSQSKVIGRKQYLFMIPEGITLLQLINQNGRLSRIQIEEIYKQLLQALHQIHTKYSLGRCFHVGNIYYHNNSIQMAAFGFYPNLQLIPPEFLVRGEQSQNRIYSQSIDVWLVGCIIYQLFTGQVLNSFKTLKEYLTFYNQIQSLRIDEDWKNRLMKMLHPTEAQRCTFFQMHIHHEISNSYQEGIKEFYKNIFLTQNYSSLIKMRELIDDNYIEWAVPKEFTKQMELPKVLNPFRYRIQRPNPNPNPQIQENLAPYPRIANTTDYYSQPIQPSPPFEDLSIDDPPIQDLPIEDPPIQNRPIENPLIDPIDQSPQQLMQYPDLGFLPYRCRDQNDFIKFKDIWIELHFESYKWYLMNSLKQHIELQEIKSPVETFTVYCLLKMAVLMRQEFVSQWNNKFLNFDNELWKNFKTSIQAKKFFKDLQNQLNADLSIINDNYQLCNFKKLSSEDENIFNSIKSIINMPEQEQNSNNFKLPYRKSLRKLYHSIKNSCQQDCDNKLQLTLLQLKFIICMGISSIFSPIIREVIFIQVKRAQNISNFDNPYYLEQEFFRQQDANILNNQIKIIEEQFFQSQS